MRNSCSPAAICLAGALLVAGSGPAAAQAWIGQMVGEMAAQQAAAQRELECRKGAPADPSDVKAGNRRADKVMEAYFALTSKSTKKDIQKLFAMDQKDVSWKNENGKVPLDQLGALLDEASPTHARILSVVAGDILTTRAIWSVGEGADIVYYGVDIMNGNWLSDSKIWHVSVSKTQPDTPPAYCHFDSEQSY
jgi:hypothetical protein